MRSFLPPAAPGLGATVVVPARDEEALVGSCIRSLCAQRGIEGLAWEILLILDGCTDRTAERAREGHDQIGGPVLHEIHVDGIGAGGARAHGMNLACGRLLEAGAPGGLIATTDADSRVDPRWLANQLKALAAGAEAVGGRIELGDDSVLLDATTLSERADRHAARMATIDGDAAHPFFGGASIGISARAYESVGGMEPLIALEDEAFERRLSRARLRIARPADVRVITSARTTGRAPRGLSTDLALSEWGRRRTWAASVGDEDEIAEIKDRTVSVILPAREVAGTIGSIVATIDRLRKLGLVDELIVVDAASADGTARIAERAGARVLQESEILAEHGPCLGKGDAMWRAVSEAAGDIVVFCDADTTDFRPAFVTGLLLPILREPGVGLVKGAFERPLRAGNEVLANEGGRVTELVARPLVNLHFPELAGLEQPLAGEIAIERELFEELEVPVGYGVEIAMLIDTLRSRGIDAIGQTRLGQRQNRHQPLRSLGRMAYEVIVALQCRTGDGGAAPVAPGPLVLPGPSPSRLSPRWEERPPLASVLPSRVHRARLML